jgi:hypothetical protein
MDLLTHCDFVNDKEDILFNSFKIRHLQVPHLPQLLELVELIN